MSAQKDRIIALQAQLKIARDVLQKIACGHRAEPKANDLFIHVTPKADACEHDFKGWRDFPDGNGGEQVCTKCGTGAMAHTLSLDF